MNVASAGMGGSLKLTRVRRLVFGAVLLCAVTGCAQSGTNSSKLPIRVQVAEDSQSDWQFSEVAAGRRNAAFRPLVKPSENFGATGSTYWLRIDLLHDIRPCLIEIDYSPLPLVEFFIPEESPESERAPGAYRRVRTGREIPFEQRPLPALSHVIAIDHPTKRPVYIRIRSTYTVIGVEAYTPAAFQKKQNTQNVVFGMYYGLIIGIVAYNLFVWLSARDRSFLLYVLFIASLSLQQAVYYGLAFRFFWPEFPLIEDRAYSVFTAAANVFGLAFAYSFLNIREKVRELAAAFRVAMAVSAALLIAGIVWPRGDLLQILRVVALCSALLIMVGIVLGLMRGVREARFFLIASGFTTLAVIVFVTPMFRFIPTGIWTRHSLLASSAVDALLLSLALADRINILRFEKSAALDGERRSNEDRRMLLDITKGLSTSENAIDAVRIVLEHLSQWRPGLFGGEVSIQLSSELSERGEVQELRRPAIAKQPAPLAEKQHAAESLESRSRAGAGLEPRMMPGAFIVGLPDDVLAVIYFESQPELDARESDHMESVLHSLTLRLQAIRSATESTLATVAGFAAGVVHDIKNDVSAVQYFLEAMASNPAAEIKPGLLRDARDSLNDMLAKVHGALDYIRGDRNAKLRRLDTRTFADMIDARLRTIFAAKRQRYEIRREYSGPIAIDARRMLRAVENIAHNAAEAMAVGGRFTVGLARDEDCFTIRLQDTGGGIAPAVRERLFAAFEGSTRSGGHGLGLSIARSIVEEHGGSIHFESEPDTGTVFILRIPLSG